VVALPAWLPGVGFSMTNGIIMNRHDQRGIIAMSFFVRYISPVIVSGFLPTNGMNQNSITLKKTSMKPPVKTPFTRLWIILLIVGLGTNVMLNSAALSVELPKIVLKPSLSQLKVGDSYGGGIIIYVDASGQHGLIATAKDVATASNWYDAKMICNEFLNGYGDWCLPNKQQLNQIFLNKSLVGGVPEGVVYYWSSTEGNGSDAWYQNFATGIQKADSKIKVGRVRPVRSF